MAEIQLYYIGTSKIKEIRQGGSVTFDWGSYDVWTNFAAPIKSSTVAVKYNKTTKDAVGGASLVGNGGVTYAGTAIPAQVERLIDGVERMCDVRFYKRPFTQYTRTAALKKKKKMSRTIYSAYQYLLQYKDKPIVNKDYSTYADGVEYIYFADHYFDDEGTEQSTPGHILHPIECSLTYSDIRRNFNSEANNSDNRDNTGTYVLTNVRPNVVTLTFKWQGLSAEDGADLLDTLNPSQDTNGQYNYLIVQYKDPATGEAKTGTFFAGERSVNKYFDGSFKDISVTLTEV